MRVWYLSTYIFSIILAIICIGCSLIPIDRDGKKFQEMMNHEVGKQITESWYGAYPRTETVHGKYEHIVQDKSSGYVWAVAVDEMTGEITGWRYMSDPGLCHVEISQVW